MALDLLGIFIADLLFAGLIFLYIWAHPPVSPVQKRAEARGSPGRNGRNSFGGAGRGKIAPGSVGMKWVENHSH